MSANNNEIPLKSQVKYGLSKGFIPILTTLPGRMQNIVKYMSVFFCRLAYLRNHTTELHQIYVQIACGRTWITLPPTAS